MKKAGKLFSFLMLAVFVLIIVSSCHKYPNDPFISLNTPTKRLTKITLALTSYKINGVDSVNKFNVSGTRASIEFGNNGRNNFFCNGSGDEGTWDFSNNSADLKIGNYDTAITHNGRNEKFMFPMGPSSTWDIKELYKKNFKISSNIHGVSFELTFKAN